MTTRMLIDARHREETRVAVVKGNQIEEFDFESAEHLQLKGNIYLAKVTRVEPSLQAAFVDYGGNRHGFLAFSEIHPDYYQIPKEDRDRLIAEEQEAAAEEARAREAEEDEGDMSFAPGDEAEDGDVHDSDEPELVEVDKDISVDTIDQSEGQLPEDEDGADHETDDAETADGQDSDDAKTESDGNNRRGRGRRGRGKGNKSAAKQSDSARAKRIALRRRYKIQDVIHRRQVMLVQVVKEERGNKGAALTTYLSLAGRYCVLMPNTSHGGGISRKISSASDRKRLKSIVDDLKLPATMGCIIRTAGLQRTKTEIKRDFDYLARLWDDIREQTLKGSAPMLIHTDSDLVKRAIRDIYNREIDEVMVEGEEGYKAAKDFMKLLMPSHARRVKQYADPVPLFQRYGVEDQLSAMYHPVVQLKSGGYIVINPTEALVSIDINSGRSTKEHGIEQTAVATNLEAAREIARQLRLRDMAGLVVIDFIDMENYSNIRKVERAMKDALKNDRARIQVGKISSFGLMEMSRQRLRTGVLEASTRECPHCEGTGLVRTASSSALSALRMLEEEAAKGKGSTVRLSASQEAAIYVLNNKRAELAEIEQRYGVTVEIAPNGDSQGAKMEASSTGPRPDKKVSYDVIQDDAEDNEDGNESGGGSDNGRADQNDQSSDEEGKGRRKRRRRGRRGGRGRRQQENGGDEQSDNQDGDAGDPAYKSDEADQSVEASNNDGQSDVEAKADKPKRRSSRRSRKQSDEAEQIEAQSEQDDSADATASDTGEEAKVEEKPKRRRSRAKKSDATEKGESKSEAADKQESGASDDAEAKAEKPKRRRTKKATSKKSEGSDEVAAKSDAAPAEATPAEAAVSEEQPAAQSPEAAAQDQAESGSATADNDSGENESPRRGWWQRTFGE